MREKPTSFIEMCLLLFFFISIFHKKVIEILVAYSVVSWLNKAIDRISKIIFVLYAFESDISLLHVLSLIH